MFSFLLVLSLLFAGSEQLITDFCKTSYCKPGVQNVGCNPPPIEGGPACEGKLASEANLTIYGQKIIVHQHNLLRSRLAKGELKPFAAASRMPLLIWDDELAVQASHNTRSCVLNHDECPNTAQFRFVGQNIDLFRYTYPSIEPPYLIVQRIYNWWREFNQTTQAQLDNYPSITPTSPIEHFAQMINDRAWKIGCSIQRWFDAQFYNVFYFVCNYSFRNMPGQPVYTKGPPASQCATGEHEVYPGLCSVREYISSTPNAITN
ncbi:antigen 5 like allergen Cul n 1-like [Anopheles nili]|uniref:antigen 5 like allergen Cul n 1-like n=1 Tax=Anopheles nili TaxID=185578 RepID=UPI00237B5B47|nr:antigen 5 like allergen Cul n 1-like [Anopheles nili]